MLALALDNPFPEGWKHLLLTFVIGDQSAFGLACFVSISSLYLLYMVSMCLYLTIFVGLKSIVELEHDDSFFLSIFFPLPSQISTHCFVLFTDEYVPGGWWYFVCTLSRESSLLLSLCRPSLSQALFDELISTSVSGLSLVVVLGSKTLPGGWCLHELIELVDAAELLPDGWCSAGILSSVSDSES